MTFKQFDLSQVYRKAGATKHSSWGEKNLVTLVVKAVCDAAGI